MNGIAGYQVTHKYRTNPSNESTIVSESVSETHATSVLQIKV